MHIILVTGDRAAGKSELLDQLALRGVSTLRLGRGRRIQAHDQARARQLGVIQGREVYDPERHARGLEAAVLHQGGWNSFEQARRRGLMFWDGVWGIASFLISLHQVVAVEVPLVTLDFRVYDPVIQGWREHLWYSEYFRAALTPWNLYQHRWRLALWLLRTPMAAIGLAGVCSAVLAAALSWVRAVLQTALGLDYPKELAAAWLCSSVLLLWLAQLTLTSWLVVVTSDRQSQLERLMFRYALPENSAGKVVGARSLIVMGGPESMVRRDLNVPWHRQSGEQVFREKSERVLSSGLGAGDKAGVKIVNKVCRMANFTVSNLGSTPTAQIAQDAATLLYSQLKLPQQPTIPAAARSFGLRVLLALCAACSTGLLCYVAWDALWGQLLTMGRALGSDIPN